MTLSHGGRTRACQGTIHPRTETLEHEASLAARAALRGDGRFPALVPGKSDRLTLRVSLVRDIQPVRMPEEIDPSRDGLWLRAGPGGEKNAVILPGEARTRSFMIAEAHRRAGIRPGEAVELHRLVLEWHEALLLGAAP